MKIIFLDIDGVLNNWTLIQKYGIDIIADSLLNRLDFILTNTDAKIVLSSTWRCKKSDLDIVKKRLKDFGFDNRFIGTTIEIEHSLRDDEIYEWLDRHKEVTRFAVLDDNASIIGEDFGDSFFETDGEVGLTDEIAEKVIAHLNKIP